MWYIEQIEGAANLEKYINDNNILTSEIKDITVSGSWFTLVYFRL